MIPNPLSARKRFHKKRLVISLLLLGALLWVGRYALIQQMILPRLVLRPPVPTLKPPLTPDDIPIVAAVTVSPDGKTIWSGGELAFVKSRGKSYLSPAMLPIYAWDGRTGKLRYTLSGHGRLVDALACSPDGSRLASSGWDNSVKMWDTATGRLLWTHPGNASTLAFSPDSKLLAVYGEFWNAATGNLVRVLNGRSGEGGIAFSPDGKTFACVTGDYKVVNKTPAENQRLEPDQTPDVIKAIGHHVQLWNVSSGYLSRTLPYDLTQAVAFSPDGNWLATLQEVSDIPGGIGGARIHLVNVQTGTEKWAWVRRDHDGVMWSMTSLVFSPNGKWLACGTLDHDVVLLNASTGAFARRLHTYEWPRDDGSYRMTVSALAFSRDGKTLLGRGSRTVQVWDTSRLP